MTHFRVTLLVIALSSALSFSSAKDAIYSLEDDSPTGMSVDRDELVVRMKLETIALPKAKRISLIESKGSHEGGFVIQIDLAAVPPKSFKPVVVLGERTLVQGVMVGGSDEAGYAITLGSNDLASARDWLKRLQELFGLPDSQVVDYAKVEPSNPKK